MSSFHDLLRNADPIKQSRGGRTGQFRFTSEDVQEIYAARKRGISWGQINNLLENAGEKNYTRHGSLAQSVHNAAKYHGIEPPFPKQHRAKKHVHA